MNRAQLDNWLFEREFALHMARSEAFELLAPDLYKLSCSGSIQWDENSEEPFWFSRIMEDAHKYAVRESGVILHHYYVIGFSENVKQGKADIEEYACRFHGFLAESFTLYAEELAELVEVSVKARWARIIETYAHRREWDRDRGFEEWAKAHYLYLHSPIPPIPKDVKPSMHTFRSLVFRKPSSELSAQELMKLRQSYCIGSPI